MKKRGRPTVYTEAIAAEICTRLAAGESLNAICRDARMPPESTVREWVDDDRGNDGNGRPGFAATYTRARSRGYERLADELIAISDDPCLFDGKPDHALVQRARLMSDNRKWLLSKMLPRRYGDRVEITGDANAPLLTRIELVAVRPELPAQDDGDETSVTPLRAITSR